MPRKRAVQKPTTIWVDESVKKELEKLKKRGETFNEVIQRLLKAFRSCKEVEGI